MCPSLREMFKSPLHSVSNTSVYRRKGDWDFCQFFHNINKSEKTELNLCHRGIYLYSMFSEQDIVEFVLTFKEPFFSPKRYLNFRC